MATITIVPPESISKDRKTTFLVFNLFIVFVSFLTCVLLNYYLRSVIKFRKEVDKNAKFIL